MKELLIIILCIVLCMACYSRQERKEVGNTPTKDSVTAIDTVPKYKDTIIITLDKTYYSPKEKFIYYTIENFYDSVMSFLDDDIQKYNGKKWEKVPLDVNYGEVGVGQAIGSKKVRLKTRLYPIYKLSKGKYRIAMYFRFDKHTYVAYGEFYIR